MQHLKLSSIAIKLTIDVIDLLSNSEQMALTELFSLVFQLPLATRVIYSASDRQ